MFGIFQGMYSTLYSAVVSVSPDGKMLYIMEGKMSLLDLFIWIFWILMLIAALRLEKGIRKVAFFLVFFFLSLYAVGIVTQDDVDSLTEAVSESTSEAIISVLHSSGDCLINVGDDWVTPTAITEVVDISDEGFGVVINGVTTYVILSDTRVIDLNSSWGMLNHVNGVKSLDDGTVAIYVGEAYYIFTPDNLLMLLSA